RYCSLYFDQLSQSSLKSADDSHKPIMKLLLVEDNDRMREIIKNLVQDLAAAIYECRDGSEALSAYAEHRPDWVLMDIKMEKLDGLSATRQIKAAYPDAKIMMVTN